MKIIAKTNASIHAYFRAGLLHLTITHGCGKNWEGGTCYRGGWLGEPEGFLDCINFDCNQTVDGHGYFWICAETEQDKIMMDGTWYFSQSKDQEYAVCVPLATLEECRNSQVLAGFIPQ